jgi:hypothetical protein
MNWKCKDSLAFLQQLQVQADEVQVALGSSVDVPPEFSIEPGAGLFNRPTSSVRSSPGTAEAFSDLVGSLLPVSSAT